MSLITLKTLKKAKKICDSFNAEVYFAYTSEGSSVCVKERNIIVDLEGVFSTNQFWSIIFHELAHIYCYDNKLYYKYHSSSLKKKEMAKYIRKIGLKAERFVDRIGERLMKEHGFKEKYIKAYISKEDVDWYKNWINKEYPL